MNDAGTARPLILLVDDDEDIRSGLAPFLERSGFEVVQAGDGQAALDFLEAAGTARPDFATTSSSEGSSTDSTSCETSSPSRTLSGRSRHARSRARASTIAKKTRIAMPSKTSTMLMIVVAVALAGSGACWGPGTPVGGGGSVRVLFGDDTSTGSIFGVPCTDAANITITNNPTRVTSVVTRFIRRTARGSRAATTCHQLMSRRRSTSCAAGKWG
ncbi:MAG TPA: hypothetical protein DIW46_07915 [Microbacterium sp.]|nr:hypothetical protein [Microbacterium sp.]